jgi:tight adherence protein B
MVALITIGTFVVVLCIVLLVGNVMAQRNASARLYRERLHSINQAAARGSSPELDLLRNEVLSEIPALQRFLATSAYGQGLRHRLAQAQMKIRPGFFILLSIGLGAVCSIIAYSVTRHLLLTLIFTIGGAALPTLALNFRRRRRFKKFEDKFPEAIDLLGRSIRAGHAFSTALELIATETEEPIAGEFRKLFEEQKFGLPLRDALFNLGDRVPLIDVKFFGTAVLLQKETGGNLAELLDKLSYVMRERFKILRQLRVYTAQGRLTLLILMALPPILLFVLSMLNPEFVHPLFHDPLGHNLIAVGLVLQATGYFMIRRIIDIKV